MLHRRGHLLMHDLRLITLDDIRRPTQTAEQVVATTLAANDRGQVVVVPGLHNKIAATILRYVPQPLLIAILSRASAKYHLVE